MGETDDDVADGNLFGNKPVCAVGMGLYAAMLALCLWRTRVIATRSRPAGLRHPRGVFHVILVCFSALECAHSALFFEGARFSVGYSLHLASQWLALAAFSLAYVQWSSALGARWPAQRLALIVAQLLVALVLLFVNIAELSGEPDAESFSHDYRVTYTLLWIELIGAQLYIVVALLLHSAKLWHKLSVHRGWGVARHLKQRLRLLANVSLALFVCAVFALLKLLLFLGKAGALGAWSADLPLWLKVPCESWLPSLAPMLLLLFMFRRPEVARTGGYAPGLRAPLTPGSRDAMRTDLSTSSAGLVLPVGAAAASESDSDSDSGDLVYRDSSIMEADVLDDLVSIRESLAIAAGEDMVYRDSEYVL